MRHSLIINDDIYSNFRCDLSSLRSVRDCADEINTKEGRVDVLINNAGLAFQPYSRTEDGLEIVIATNHFGHFLFTNLLLEKLKVSFDSQILIYFSLPYRVV